MKRVHRLPTLTLALVVVLLLSFAASPSPAGAAALTQTETVTPAVLGYYQSDVLPAADSPGLQVALILYEDNTAEVYSDYLNDEPPVVEVGTWEENDDGTLTLTVTGTTEVEYQQAIALTFEVAENGALVVPGEPGGPFGEEGLILNPAELPVAEAGMGEAVPVAIEIPADATAYQSEILPAPDTPGLQFTLLLYADGAVEMISDSLNQVDIVTEIGEWIENDDGTITVTLTGQPGEEYAEPIVLLFSRTDEGGLALIDEDGLFGDQGLTLAPLGEAAAEAAAAATPEPAEEPTAATPAAEPNADAVLTVTAPVSPAGAYVSDLLPAEDAPGSFMVVIFYPDGGVLASTYTLDGSLPVTELGSWAPNADAGATVTVTGTTESEYVSPVEVDFSFGGDGTLLQEDVVFHPLPLADTLDVLFPTVVATFRSETLPAASGPGRVITLTLYDDETAEFATDFLNGEDPVVEIGGWSVGVTDTMTVTLTGQAGQDYEEPVVLVFSVDEDDVLTLVDAPEGLFGEEGLTLSLVDTTAEAAAEATPEALPLPEATAEPTAEPTEEPTPEPTEAPTATPTAAPTATPTAEPTPAPTEEPTPEPTAEPAETGAAIYQSAVLPSASSPGLQITLSLVDDGTAAMEYDYLNDDEVVTNTGSWEENDGGTLTVTLVEGPNGPFLEPGSLTLAQTDDGGLVIIDASEDLVGLTNVVLAAVE